MRKDPTNSKGWHVVTTRSRAEKKVYSNLLRQNIESFLPLQKRLRQWKDRKKWVETPVISGYCFVNIEPKEYEKVLRTEHVAGFIRFEGKPARIPNLQIDYLKKMLNQSDFEVEVSQENFKPGKRVEIVEGPLIGLQGELLSYRGKDRFMLRIEQMNTMYSVEITAEKITAVPNT
ncbi:MAG TPA: UpxY family transcription antiterminator [Mariniphaga sp.]|nr:UpxY family transcription antiterminator [Mariniphaga sp.]